MYTVARVENALEHALKHLSGSASATYPAAFKAGIEALKTKDLTTVVAMSGSAMLPTLNGSASYQPLSFSLSLLTFCIVHVRCVLEAWFQCIERFAS